MDANIFIKANQIIKTCDAAYLGVIDEDGYPHVSTVSTIKPKDIFTAYFATGMGANKTKRLIRNKRASVCYRSGSNNITLVGEVEILTDQETKSRCWLDWFINHFPGGETDPNYCIIKFTTKRMSLWIDGDSAEKTLPDLSIIQSYCGCICDGCEYKESKGCKGCLENKGEQFWGECDLAKCCIQKGYAHCGECPDIPCETMRNMADDDDPKGARMVVCKAWAAKKNK
jgi:general stress protein 26